MVMVEYIRGSENDRWHWCKNCTQYPMYIYQKTSVEPSSNTREENRDCKMQKVEITEDPNDS
jgi:hypothetical protein